MCMFLCDGGEKRQSRERGKKKKEKIRTRWGGFERVSNRGGVGGVGEGRQGRE